MSRAPPPYRPPPPPSLFAPTSHSSPICPPRPTLKSPPRTLPKPTIQQKIPHHQLSPILTESSLVASIQSNISLGHHEILHGDGQFRIVILPYHGVNVPDSETIIVIGFDETIRLQYLKHVLVNHLHDKWVAGYLTAACQVSLYCTCYDNILIHSFIH